MTSSPSAVLSSTPAITGVGAVTSVGLDAATSCASIRAGLSRPTELSHSSVSYLDYALTPTMGHEVPVLTRGFSNIGRWLPLSAAAIEDLCVSARLPSPGEAPEFWASTAAYLVLPEIDERFEHDRYCTEAALPRHYQEPLLGMTAARFAPRWVTLVPGGRISVFEISSSVPWQPDLDRAIIVATDSLVDASGLAWLEENGRLKSDMNPVGLRPGEASVAVLLESPRAARHRGQVPSVFLRAVATETDSEKEQGGSGEGAALARAVSQVLRAEAMAPASHVADLNGEVWRARELALARQRVEGPGWPERAILPALSVGDPGAAMSALQVAVAVASLQRGWSGGASVLVTSSEPGGRVASAIIGAGEGP